MIALSSYKKPLAELGLQNRLALAVARSREGKEITSFFPGSEGRVFLVHSPALVKTVLGPMHKTLVEDKHPYSFLFSVFSDMGRRSLLLAAPDIGASDAAEILSTHLSGSWKRYQPLWRSFADADSPVDLFPHLSLLVLEIMGRVLFDFEMGSLAERFFLSSMQHEDFLAVSRRGTGGSPLAQAKDEVKGALLEQEAVAGEILRGRKDAGAQIPPLPKGIPVERALVRTLLNAYAGTATTLAWLALLLAKYTDVQERVRAELEGAAKPGAAAPYTDCVIKEALRLYPTAWMMSRFATESLSLAGQTIPEGGVVFVCTYTLHRDPSLWSEPERFLPERFTTAEFGGGPSHSYLPFGAGPHRCAGMKLAMDAMRGVLGLLTKDLRFVETSVPIEPFPRVALQPEPGAFVRLVRR